MCWLIFGKLVWILFVSILKSRAHLIKCLGRGGVGRSCKAVVVEEATAREIIGCEHTRQSNRTIKTRKQKQCVNGKKNFFYWLLPTNQQLNSIQKNNTLTTVNTTDHYFNTHQHFII